MSRGASPPQSIAVDGVTRRFGDLTAVDQVSFDVPAGVMTGFVGGNGAGKTTTMRMIMGVLAAHAGEVRWGERPITTEDRRQIGYMPEERGLYPKQRVLEQLIHLGRLKGTTAKGAEVAASGLLERLGLGERMKDPVEKLSLGNQQRVQVIASLMTEPDALVLDEPFSGLDPAAVDSMAQLLREHTARGVPVLFSSHQLDLVERLCDRLVVMAGGRVRAEGSVGELRSAGLPRVRVVSEEGDASWVHEVPGVTVREVDGASAVLELTAPDAAGQRRTRESLLQQGMARGGVRELATLTPSLSEIYREVTA